MIVLAEMSSPSAAMSLQADDCALMYDTDDDLLSISDTDSSDACQQHAQKSEYLRFYDPDDSMQAVKDHIRLRFPSLSVVDVESTASTDAQMLRSRGMDFEIMLSEPPLGTSILELEEALSQSERMSCDWQTGQLFRRIASNISPTGYFGPTAHVLAEHTSMPWLSDSVGGTYLRSDIGYPSWSQAFGELFYTALEEAGKSRITLPSYKLHVAFERFRPVFDVVKRPSLVAVDGCEDSHVLVLRRKESKRYASSRPSVSDASEDESADDAFRNIGNLSTDVKVTGLKNWGHFVFGDPLFATCFLNTASEDLTKGMNTAFSADDPLGDADLVEDPQGAHIRLLFYDIVHTMRGIARQHKGVRTPDSAQKEDMWWARLRKALAKLDVMTAQEEKG
ncbi:uncharacterized protein J7T54_007706 [Emericellopsis cladophorae]|uniref:Uncharacterized protein n=1 Tax=Emericellopsis cladophorae TaxID=2686198 RepID=A0A9P9XY08_9HYPO|nr:uncharacterized protein J7T54_007706 [Emericellopsis cladophorae]KAI6779663.1 hypothetical protein J7T54_007706 [Emericellopsis cladophorae]